MHERILIDPAVMFGKPVIRGTRLPVDFLRRRLAEGRSVERLLEDHPRLTREGVSAALEFAADELVRAYVPSATPA